MAGRKLAKDASVALLAAFGATGLRYLCNPILGMRAPFLFHVLAVAVAAQVAGTIAGLVTTVLSAGFLDYLFIPPLHTIAPPPDPTFRAALLLFTVVGICLSVSGGRRKRTADDLERAHKRLALKHEIARIGSFEWFVPQGRVQWSPDMEAIYGVPTSDHVHTLEDWKRTLHPDDRSQAVAALEETARRRLPAFDDTYRIIRPDGRIRWVHTRRKYEYDSHGNPLYVMGVDMDVTEMKQAEEKIRRIQFNLEAAQNIANIGSWESELDGALWWSDETYRIFGFDPRSPVTTDDFYEVVHPEDREIVRAAVRTATETGRDYDIQHRILRKSDGQLRYVRERAKVLINERVLLIGSTQDITETHKASIALQSAFERLALTHEAARIGTFEWFVQENRVEWSVDMERLYGIESTGHQHTFDEWKTYVHPEDLEHTLAAVEAAVSRRRVDFEATFRITRRDGEVAWIHSRGKYQYDAGGRPLHMLGINMDVSELKRTEEAVRQTNAQLEAILDSVPEPMMVTDAAGTLLRINSAFKQSILYQTTVDNYVGRVEAFEENGKMIPPEDWPINRVRRGERVNRWDVILSIDGVRSNRRFSGSPVLDDKGQVTHAVVNFFDITDLKQGEMAQQILGGLVQVCSSCRRIHDSASQEWYSMEGYLRQRTPAKFSHGMCPDCIRQWYSDETK